MIYRDDEIISESRELRALGPEVVTDLPPSALQLGGTHAANDRLIAAVNEAILAHDWRELWILLHQIEAWERVVHLPNAERPWWMLQGAASTGVAEFIDISESSQPGFASWPVDLCAEAKEAPGILV